MPAPWTINEWPTSYPELAERLRLIDSTHVITPLPARDIAGQWIHPKSCEETLRGSTVAVTFGLRRFSIKNTTVSLVAESVRVLEEPRSFDDAKADPMESINASVADHSAGAGLLLPPSLIRMPSATPVTTAQVVVPQPSLGTTDQLVHVRVQQPPNPSINTSAHPSAQIYDVRTSLEPRPPTREGVQQWATHATFIGQDELVDASRVRSPLGVQSSYPLPVQNASLGAPLPTGSLAHSASVLEADLANHAAGAHTRTRLAGTTGTANLFETNAAHKAGMTHENSSQETQATAGIKGRDTVGPAHAEAWPGQGLVGAEGQEVQRRELNVRFQFRVVNTSVSTDCQLLTALCVSGANDYFPRSCIRTRPCALPCGHSCRRSQWRRPGT